MIGTTPKPRIEIEIVVESRCFCCSGFIKSPKKKEVIDPELSDRIKQAFDHGVHKGTPDTDTSIGRS